MDRLFVGKRLGRRCLAGLAAAIWLALMQAAAHEPAQPVFFSMLFPQLMPAWGAESLDVMTPGEAVAL